jgi:hypothetical protein
VTKQEYSGKYNLRTKTLFATQDKFGTLALPSKLFQMNDEVNVNTCDAMHAAWEAINNAPPKLHHVLSEVRPVSHSAELTQLLSRKYDNQLTAVGPI